MTNPLILIDNCFIKLFYKTIVILNKYENIIIYLKTPIDRFQIRKNLNEILY